jgi:hypothetical protein
MTPSQDKKYWREWAQVTRACKTHGFDLPDRHDLHRRALGKDKSHKSFTNADFDKVLAVFRSYIQPDNIKPQLRQQRMPRLRLEWKITVEQSALLAVLLPDPSPQSHPSHSENSSPLTPHSSLTALDRALAAETYIQHLMQERFHTTDLRSISDEPRPRGGNPDNEYSDLELLRDTLAARINELRKKRGWTIHEMNQLATVACPKKCSICHPKRVAVISAQHRPGEPALVPAGAEDNNRPF